MCAAKAYAVGRLGRLPWGPGALVAGDEVAVFVGADGDVGEFLEEAEDGFGDGVLVKWGGGPGDDVPEYGEEFPPVHGGEIIRRGKIRNSKSEIRNIRAWIQRFAMSGLLILYRISDFEFRIFPRLRSSFWIFPTGMRWFTGGTCSGKESVIGWSGWE